MTNNLRNLAFDKFEDFQNDQNYSNQEINTNNPSISQKLTASLERLQKLIFLYKSKLHSHKKLNDLYNNSEAVSSYDSPLDTSTYTTHSTASEYSQQSKLMAVQTQDDAENKNFTKNDIQTEIKNDATIDKTDEKSDKNDEISPQKTIAITTIGFKLQPKTSQNTQNSTDPHPTAALSPHALAAIMAQFSAHFSLKPDSDGFAQNFYAEISKRSETDLFSDEDLAIGVAISARKSDLDVLGRLVAVLLTKRTGIIVLNEIVKWILNFQNQHKNGDKSSGHNHRKNGDKNDQKKNGKKHQNEPEKAHEMVKNDEVSEKMRKSAEHVLAKTRHRVVKKFAVFGGYDLAGDALGVTELPLELFVLLLSADQILTDAENSVWLVAAYWVLKNVPRVAFAAAGGAGALEAKRVFGALRLYRMDKSYLFNVQKPWIENIYMCRNLIRTFEWFLESGNVWRAMHPDAVILPSRAMDGLRTTRHKFKFRREDIEKLKTMSRPLIGSSRLFAHGYCLYVALSVGSERDEAPRLFLSVNVDRDHSLMRRERAFSYALAFEYRCGTRRWKGVRVICDEKSNWEFEAGRVDQLQFEKGYVKGGVRKLCIK